MTITLDKHVVSIRTQADEKMSVAQYLFLIFWVMKSFYLWKSGSMQISDFFFVASFMTWLISKRGRIVAEAKDLYFFYIALGDLS